MTVGKRARGEKKRVDIERKREGKSVFAMCEKMYVGRK